MQAVFEFHEKLASNVILVFLLFPECDELLSDFDELNKILEGANAKSLQIKQRLQSLRDLGEALPIDDPLRPHLGKLEGTKDMDTPMRLLGEASKDTEAKIQELSAAASVAAPAGAAAIGAPAAGAQPAGFLPTGLGPTAAGSGAEPLGVGQSVLPSTVLNVPQGGGPGSALVPLQHIAVRGLAEAAGPERASRSPRAGPSAEAPGPGPATRFRGGAPTGGVPTDPALARWPPGLPAVAAAPAPTSGAHGPVYRGGAPRAATVATRGAAARGGGAASAPGKSYAAELNAAISRLQELALANAREWEAEPGIPTGLDKLMAAGPNRPPLKLPARTTRNSAAAHSAAPSAAPLALPAPETRSAAPAAPAVPAAAAPAAAVGAAAAGEVAPVYRGEAPSGPGPLAAILKGRPNWGASTAPSTNPPDASWLKGLQASLATHPTPDPTSGQAPDPTSGQAPGPPSGQAAAPPKPEGVVPEPVAQVGWPRAAQPPALAETLALAAALPSAAQQSAAGAPDPEAGPGGAVPVSGALLPLPGIGGPGPPKFR